MWGSPVVWEHSGYRGQLGHWENRSKTSLLFARCTVHSARCTSYVALAGKNPEHITMLSGFLFLGMRKTP